MTTERTARVLLVDDEPQIRATVSEVLMLEGYEVLPAGNGEEALSLLEQVPDVVILDLWMPVIDGWAFRREQLLRHPEIPVIVLSATGLSPAELDELRQPIVVEKPFDLETLLTALEKAIGRG